MAGRAPTTNSGGPAGFWGQHWATGPAHSTSPRSLAGREGAAWGGSCGARCPPTHAVLRVPPGWQPRGAGPERHPGPQRHQRRGGRARPPGARGPPGRAGRAWHHRETRRPGTCRPRPRRCGRGRVSGCQRTPSMLTDLWGEFQGKEASEQRIRELCGGLVSGECPYPTRLARRPRSRGAAFRTGGGSLPQGLTWCWHTGHVLSVHLRKS